MKFSISKEQFAKILSTAENALNLVGYIPMISALSGAIRLAGAKVQMLGGVLATVFLLLKGIYGKSFKAHNFQKCRLAIEQILHGAFNFCRALVELVPFLSLFLCLPYDRLLHRRLKYTYEESEILEEDVIDI